jgi:hypothetical protein
MMVSSYFTAEKTGVQLGVYYEMADKEDVNFLAGVGATP